MLFGYPEKHIPGIERWVLTNMTGKNKVYIQMGWGILLVLAGIGVFFRIPQVMPQIKQIEYFASIIWFVYFCFYMLAILLILGGSNKIYTNYKKLRHRNSNDAG